MCRYFTDLRLFYLLNIRAEKHTSLFKKVTCVNDNTLISLNSILERTYLIPYKVAQNFSAYTCMYVIMQVYLIYISYLFDSPLSKFCPTIYTYILTAYSSHEEY